MDQSLARMREAHQKAVSAAMALEEEIERLCQMRAHSQSTVRSKIRDCQRSGEQGCKKRCCHVSFEDEPTPGQSANPDMLPGEEGSKGRDSKLGEMLELQPEVASFLQASPNTSDDEDRKVLLEPAVLNFAKWVSWKVARCDTPAGGWNY